MARNPNKIKGLNQYQLTAYRKSFLVTLDESPNVRLSDWEAEFVESAMGRTSEYTPKQVGVIERLMDKFPSVNPRFKDYNDPEAARVFVEGDKDPDDFM